MQPEPQSGEVGGKAGGRRRRATQPLNAKVNPRARWATSAHRANGYTVRGNARVSNQKATRLVVMWGSLLLIARPQHWRACQPFCNGVGLYCKMAAPSKRMVTMLETWTSLRSKNPQIHVVDRFVPSKT